MQHALGTGSEPHCHARIASVSSALLLRKLPKSQKYLSGHWGVPPAGVEHHWLKEEATGTKRSHRLFVYCRSALNSAGRHWMPAEPATHSSRGQNYAWQCDSSHLCTKHTLYHVCDSKGHVPRFPDHQSRISMHDGPKKRECNFDFKCMQTKQTKVPIPITNSRGKECMLMQCNLIMLAIMQCEQCNILMQSIQANMR